MNFIKRLLNLFRAWFGAGLTAVEDSSTDVMLQQTLQDLQDELPRLNNQLAQTIAARNMMQIKVTQASKNVAQIDKAIQLAVSRGQEDQARQLISQLQLAQQELENANQHFNTANATSERAKELYNQAKADLEQKKIALQQMIAMQSAAGIAVNTATSQVSFSSKDLNAQYERLKGKVEHGLALASAKHEMAQLSTGNTNFESSLAARTIQEAETENILAKYRQQATISGSLNDDSKASQGLAPTVTKTL